MKIPNTVCSGCNQLLDLIYFQAEDVSCLKSGICRNCAKEYPVRYCNVCNSITIHLGNNYRACVDCILSNGLNLETEFNKSLKFGLMFLGCLEELNPTTFPGIAIKKELELFYESLERRGYVEKYYINDSNKHVQDGDQGIPTEQPRTGPEENK